MNVVRRPLWLRALLLLGLLGLALPLRAEAPVRLIGAELPPYAYQQGERITGLGVEILQQLARRLGHDDSFTLMPFKRAYQNARSGGNVLITPVARVEAREGQVQWALHFVDDSFFYVTRKGEAPMTHADARDGARVGVLAGSAPLAELHANGITNADEHTLDTTNIELLQRQRIDAWFTSALLLNGAFLANPTLDPADFVIGPVQSRHCVYAVASNATPADVLAPWREAFLAMQADGSYQAILERYLDPRLQPRLGLDALRSSRCRW